MRRQPFGAAFFVSFLSFRVCNTRCSFASMETIRGIDAIAKAEIVSKMGGTFSIVFFPFSRKKQSKEEIILKTYSGCSCRKPLPKDRFDIDGKHFFLFQDSDGKPKTCYRNLIRYIGFPDDNYTLKKVIWYE